MAALTQAKIFDITARHPAVFEGSRRKRLGRCLIAGAAVAYLVFAWQFFAIGAVLAGGNWNIAGSYLADRVSYEVRPDIEFQDDYLEVSYPRFSPLGDNPNPDWVRKQTALVERTVNAPSAGSGGGASSSGASCLGPVGGAPAPTGYTTAPADFKPETVREEAVIRAVVEIGSGNVVDIISGLVTVTRGSETLVINIEQNESVSARGPLPAWAEQKGPGQKIFVGLGFAGRAEIEDDEVKIRHRFLGWENFLFDTNSPFWGKSAGQVAGLLFFGECIAPEMSNGAIAWNNILYNAEWQHLDVWTKLLQTIVMAFVGTVLASLLAFPLAFAAARNIMPNRLANQALKRVFDFLRSVDMLIWALFFTRAFGPGPLAGISAIFFTDTGTFGKLYSEALENIDDRQREGVRSVGAAPSLVQRFGVVPQVLPVFLSQSLYFWESNTRSATIIGAVGAGGIGLKLWEAMRTNSDWENVAYMVLLILIVVFVFDAVSNALRSRLIGGQE
ncbi:MAG: phosphonate ABC transporter, permease protein PhnE [Pseudaminobacter sp.]|nr:phosphonate ABC transporter, permease protein PhnE [Pseudaminobacter sp.]